VRNRGLWYGGIGWSVCCAWKLCCRWVPHGCVCGDDMAMACGLWWFPWWGCGLLSRCVCFDVCGMI